MTYMKKVSVLKYLFGKANISEALLNGIKLLGVEFAGDNVLHHSAGLTFNIPAGRSSWSSFPWCEEKNGRSTTKYIMIKTIVLTWEASCLVACRSSACFGGRGRHICNKRCESSSLPWKIKTEWAVRNVTKGTPVASSLSSTYVACLMTLDFSSRYSDILAPMTAPVGVNFISRYLPKRLELSFIAVQAFPKASTNGLTCRIFSRNVRLLAWEQQTCSTSKKLRYLKYKALVWTHLTRSRWPLCCCTFPKKVRCWTIKWALSVFPAPLSPLIIIH